MQKQEIRIQALEQLKRNNSIRNPSKYFHIVTLKYKAIVSATGIWALVTAAQTLTLGLSIFQM